MAVTQADGVWAGAAPCEVKVEIKVRKIQDQSRKGGRELRKALVPVRMKRPTSSCTKVVEFSPLKKRNISPLKVRVTACSRVFDILGNMLICFEMIRRRVFILQ